MIKGNLTILTFLSLVWGSSFILIKKGLVAFTPGQLGSLRILIAALFLLPVLLHHRKRLRSLPLLPIVLFGLFEIGIPPYLYAFAQVYVSSTSAGILNSLVPLFTVFLGLIFFRQRTGPTALAGVLLGLIGAAALVYSGGGPSTGTFFNPWGLLIVLATLLYAIAANIAERHLAGIPASLLTAVAFVSMAIPAALYLFFLDFPATALTQTSGLRSLLAICILAILGSALAIQLFSLLIQKSTALFASLVTYLIPVVAFMWGLLDGESIGPSHIAAMILIMGGIFLSAGKKRKTLRIISPSEGAPRESADRCPSA
jgi:drug/metabolite transporter (DMT)-like permease